MISPLFLFFSVFVVKVDVWFFNIKSFKPFSVHWCVCFVQDGPWWDWLTENWNEWESCRRRRGSTSCNRFYSFGCGRKWEPSSSSHKVEISAFHPFETSTRRSRSSFPDRTLDLQLSRGKIIHSVHPDKYSNHSHCCACVCVCVCVSACVPSVVMAMAAFWRIRRD